MQDNVYRAVNWLEDWQINFGNEKGKHMHLGPNSDFSKWYIARDKSGEPVVTIQNEKDLGVIFDDKFKFSLHIQNCVKSTNRNLGIIRRTFSYMNIDTSLHLSISLTRPHLEYRSSFLPVMYKKDCIALRMFCDGL